MVKIFWKSLAALLFLALGVWAIGSEGPDAVATPLAAHGVPVGDASWSASALWDDGNAEFCAYTVSRPRHPAGRAILALGREAGARGDLLKLDHIRDLPAGLVPSHQMASVFTRRDSGALVELAATSIEARGIVTAQVEGGRLATTSYAGEGERGRSYPAGALPEDGLPAALRGFVSGPLPESLAVFPSFFTAKNAGLAAGAWHVARFETVAETPEGRLPAVALRLSAGRDFRIYTFDKASPHRLLRLESSDGTLYEMARCARIPYLKMHDPGDEAWLPAEVQG